MRWDELANGLLLKAAAGEGFGALLCIDKNIEYQQNLKSLPLPVIILDAVTSDMQDLIPFLPALLQLLESPLDMILYVIEKDGNVLRLDEPRPRRKK